MNKKLLLVLAGAWMGIVDLCGQGIAPVAGGGVSYTVSMTAVSQHMFRGRRLAGFSFQPAVELNSGNWGLGCWNSIPLRKVSGSPDPEIEIYGFYTVAIKDGLSLVPGFTGYVFPGAATDAGFHRSTFEPNLALNYTIQGVRFTPKIYYDLVARGPTYELALAYALPLARFGTELDFTANAGTYHLRDVVNRANPGTKAWGDYWLVGVAAPFQITRISKVTVGVAYTEGRNGFSKQGALPQVPRSLVAGRGVLTIDYSLSF